MADIIGPAFAAELQAAGLTGLPFSWGSDGLGPLDRLTPQQQAAVQAVLAAHNPASQPSADYVAEGEYNNLPPRLLKWMFDTHKRLNVLEGKPAGTAAQAKAYVKAL